MSLIKREKILEIACSEVTRVIIDMNLLTLSGHHTTIDHYNCMFCGCVGYDLHRKIVPYHPDGIIDIIFIHCDDCIENCEISISNILCFNLALPVKLRPNFFKTELGQSQLFIIYIPPGKNDLYCKMYCPDRNKIILRRLTDMMLLNPDFTHQIGKRIEFPFGYSETLKKIFYDTIFS